jgi:hypothetical protein
MYNPHLIWKLLTSFEVWFLVALNTMGTVVAFDVLNYDGRTGCAVFAWASVISITFIDAAHVSQRKNVSACIAFGIIAYVIVVPSFYVGAFPDIKARNINIGLSEDVEISFNNLLFIVDKFMTVELFLIKNLFTAMRHPGCYVNIKPRLTGEKITAGELRKRLKERKASVGDLTGIASSSRRGGGRGRGRGGAYSSGV